MAVQILNLVKMRHKRVEMDTYKTLKHLFGLESSIIQKIALLNSELLQNCASAEGLLISYEVRFYFGLKIEWKACNCVTEF